MSAPAPGTMVLPSIGMGVSVFGKRIEILKLLCFSVRIDLATQVDRLRHQGER